MNLMLLIYFIEMITPIKCIFSWGLFFAWVVLVITAVFWVVSETDEYDSESGKSTIKAFVKYSAATIVLLSTLNVIVPSEKTAYLMVGAYTAQKIAESPEAEKISGKVLTILNNKLEEFTIDSTKELEKKVKEVAATAAAK